MEDEKVSFTSFGSEIGDRIQRRKRILENQECEICGDKSTGKHYGVFSCDGCSGFFKRTCHRSEPFLCKGHGDCTVDKSSRNDCKACRLRKCLRSGMNVDGVQGRAARRSKKIGIISVNYVKDEVIAISDSERADLSPSANHTAVVQRPHDHTATEGPTCPQIQSEINSPEGLSNSSDSLAPAPPEPICQEPPQHLPLTPLSTVAPQVQGHTVMLNTSVAQANSTSSPGPRASTVFHVRTDSSSHDRENRRALLTESSDTSVRKVSDPAPRAQAYISQSSVILPNFNTKRPAEQARYRIVPNIRLQNSDSADNSSIPFVSVSGQVLSKPCLSPQSLHAAPPLTPPLSPLPELLKAVEPVHFQASENIQDAAARLLASSIRFARHVLCVGRISLRDQIILMEESWKELFILDAAHWDLPLELASLLNGTTIPSDAMDARQKIDVVRAAQEHVTRIHSLHLDSTEFACLKAIVLFKSETKGLKISELVEKVQDETQVLLGEYVRSQHPDQPARFGKLLLTLAIVRRMADKPLEDVFFRRSEGNDMFETLLSHMVTVG